MIIPLLIGPHQNAFILGRLIEDSCLMVHGIFHYIKKKRRGPLVAPVKVDLNKAYDRLK